MSFNAFHFQEKKVENLETDVEQSQTIIKESRQLTGFQLQVKLMVDRVS